MSRAAFNETSKHALRAYATDRFVALHGGSLSKQERASLQQALRDDPHLRRAWNATAGAFDETRNVRGWRRPAVLLLLQLAAVATFVVCMLDRRRCRPDQRRSDRPNAARTTSSASPPDRASASE